MSSVEDEADDEELAEIIRDRKVRAARAKGTNVPLLLHPKLILDYIDLWHKDPNTPMLDFKLTPGQSHMLTAFIQEEKWKFEKARQLKKAQYRKEKFLKNNVVSMTTDELVKIQSEIKVFSDDFNAYYADWKGAKVRFVKLTKMFTTNVAAPSQQEIPYAEASAQPTEELVTIQSEVKKLSDDFDAYRADWLGAKVRFVKLTEKFTSNVAAPTQPENPQAEASAQPTEENVSSRADD